MKHRAAAIRTVHRGDQIERLAISADQQMLAIVYRDPIKPDATRASAEYSRLLEQRHPYAGLRQRDGCGATGPAAADHRDRMRYASRHGRSRRTQAARAVFHAIQNLRSGVNAMR